MAVPRGTRPRVPEGYLGVQYSRLVYRSLLYSCSTVDFSLSAYLEIRKLQNSFAVDLDLQYPAALMHTVLHSKVLHTVSLHTNSTQVQP